MKVTADNKLKKLIVVDDRVLIQPVKQNDKTESGLYLPPGCRRGKKLQMRMKCGKERKAASILMLERDEDL